MKIFTSKVQMLVEIVKIRINNLKDIISILKIIQIIQIICLHKIIEQNQCHKLLIIITI